MNALLFSALFSFYTSTSDAPMRDHFYVSSFYAPLKHCYTGPVEKVCARVRDGQEIQYGNYLSGEHDYFKVIECSHDHDQVTVKSELYDDYSREPVELLS